MGFSFNNYDCNSDDNGMIVDIDRTTVDLLIDHSDDELATGISERLVHQLENCGFSCICDTLSIDADISYLSTTYLGGSYIRILYSGYRSHLRMILLFKGSIIECLPERASEFNGGGHTRYQHRYKLNLADPEVFNHITLIFIRLYIQHIKVLHEYERHIKHILHITYAFFAGLGLGSIMLLIYRSM